MMQLVYANGTILQYHQLYGAKLIILLHLAVQVAGLEVVEVVVGEEEGEPQAGHHHNQNYTWNLNNVPLFRQKKFVTCFQCSMLSIGSRIINCVSGTFIYMMK